MSTESVIPSNHLIHCRPLLLLPSIFPSIRVFSNESVLHIRWSSTGVSASASVLPVSIQDWSPLDGLVGSPCSPKDSLESSPTLQFKSINSSALSFLYSPTLTSIHDYWKNHSFDYPSLIQKQGTSTQSSGSHEGRTTGQTIHLVTKQQHCIRNTNSHRILRMSPTHCRRLNFWVLMEVREPPKKTILGPYTFKIMIRISYF